MKSRHNTIRALAIGLGLTLLVVTGTAAMMAAFSGPSPATDTYRRVAFTPSIESTPIASGHDSVLYERVVLADGRAQWVLIDEADTALSSATLARGAESGDTTADNTIYSGAARTVSYTLVVKPAGLNKPVKNCSRSAYQAYDIACNTMS